MPQFDLDGGGDSLCQHDGCFKLGTKMCHHPECRVQNNQNPLILCDACDMELHSSQHFNGHLRLDVRPHGTSLGRSISTRSCPPTGPLTDPDNTEKAKDGNVEDADEVDGMKSDSKEKSSKKISKLQRKKAYRRHHTDDQSREWFSLKFDIMGKDDIEIVAAIKGRTLREALEGIFTVRKIDLDSVNIFLDQSNTPLPLQFETYPLGGHSLIVKAKDPVKAGEDFRRSHIYNVSARTRIKEKDKDKDKLKGSQRGLKNIISLFGDSMSPLQQQSFTATPQSTADNHRRPRLSDVFMTKEKEKFQALAEKLDYYSVYGIPDIPDLLMIHRPKEENDENLYALGAWTDVVDGVEAMTKKERDQQEALWEIMVTEVKYIKKLKVIIEVFFSTLLNLQNEWLLNEIDSEKLFSNVQKLLEVHEDFWREHLVKIVQKSRQTREPLLAEPVAEAFRNFEERFGAYVKYCIEEYSCVTYMKAQMKENELFKVYVEWCENQKQCNRLKLGDLLVGPMQRLTKVSVTPQSSSCQNRTITSQGCFIHCY
ncbi:pleckstrin homology domain-containing family G member 5-like isoform X2 [Ptychodera flava]|uniref:pleckstrin homology domain-containing family G member 5-like isoform X2 n=1 Tax=Ptychodera flava TaxID=63121 RepID=UPI00396AA75B